MVISGSRELLEVGGVYMSKLGNKNLKLFTSTVTEKLYDIKSVFSILGEYFEGRRLPPLRERMSAMGPGPQKFGV